MFRLFTGASSLVLMAALLPSAASALEFGVDLPASELTAPPEVVSFLLFDSEEGENPFAVYEYESDQYQLEYEPARVRIKASPSEELDLHRLWVEAEVDGKPVSERTALTASGAADFRIAGDNGVLFQGTFDSGTIPATGEGTRFMWYPGKAALRAGYVFRDQWNDGNIGGASIAMGANTTASHPASTAMGNGTTASNSYSTAMGTSTIASGVGSTAMGGSTIASGTKSTAMGEGTTAESAFETVIGRYNTDYDPASTDDWDSTDRLFVIGNGTASPVVSRSDAMVVLKNGNTGIGISDPKVRLQVDGGTDCSVAGTNGFLVTDSTGGDNICIDSNEIMARNNGGTSTLFLNNGGGITYVGGELQVGTLAAATGTNLCVNLFGTLSLCSSSERYKELIEPLPIGLDIVEELKPVIFKWKGRDEHDLGFIAEDVSATSPLLATYNNDGQIQGVKYRQLTAVLVNAVQEQQKQIADLQAIVCIDHPEAEMCH